MPLLPRWQALITRARPSVTALIAHTRRLHRRPPDVHATLLAIQHQLTAFGGMRRRVAMGPALQDLDAACQAASARLDPQATRRLARHHRSLTLLGDEITRFQAGLQEWAETTILTNQRTVEETRSADQFPHLVRRVERVQARNRSLLARWRRGGA